MALIQSSPWLDAAQYGQGLGSALGQILLQLPQARAQVAQQLAQGQLAQRQFGLQQAQFGQEQQRIDIARQQAASQEGQRKALEMMQLAREKEFQSQTAERERLQGLGNQLSMSLAQPVPQGQQGPPAPTPQSLQMQILSSDPSALARVLGEQLIADRMANRVPPEKRFIPIPSGGGLFDTQTETQVPIDPAMKAQNLLSTGVMDKAIGALSGPNSFLLDPQTSNTLFHAVQQLNPYVGVTNAPQTQEQLPIVKTQKDYDTLQSGDIYIGGDGKKYRKP